MAVPFAPPGARRDPNAASHVAGGLCSLRRSTPDTAMAQPCPILITKASTRGNTRLAAQGERREGADEVDQNGEGHP
jgi:hypothetical protein